MPGSKSIAKDLEEAGITVKTPTVDAGAVLPVTRSSRSTSTSSRSPGRPPRSRSSRPHAASARSTHPRTTPASRRRSSNGRWDDASAELDDDRARRPHPRPRCAAATRGRRHPAERAARGGGRQGRPGQLRRRHLRAAGLHDGRVPRGEVIAAIWSATSVATAMAARRRRHGSHPKTGRRLGRCDAGMVGGQLDHLHRPTGLGQLSGERAGDRRPAPPRRRCRASA